RRPARLAAPAARLLGRAARFVQGPRQPQRNRRPKGASPMSAPDVVTTSVEVVVDPTAAFEIFTEEIGRWWRPGPINWYDSTRAIDIRFEPGVDGRWLEVYDDAAGDVLEIGRITVWEPGNRLVLLYEDGGHDL